MCRGEPLVEKSASHVPIIDLSAVPLPLSNPGDEECVLEPPELSGVLIEELDPNSEPPELSHCSSLSCIIPPPPPPPDYEYGEMCGLMESSALKQMHLLICHCFLRHPLMSEGVN